MKANNQKIQANVDASVEAYIKTLKAERRKLKVTLRKHPKCPKLTQRLADTESELAELSYFGYFHISPNQIAEMHQMSDDSILNNPLLD